MEPKNPSFKDWVIGIGASAGGLEALGQFVSHLPKEFNGAVIIAQHLAPHSKSMMVELLNRNSTLPVKQAENGMKFEPATIYVVPPNHDIDIEDSHMVLRMADEAIRPKPSVDELFESLAKARGEKCVGIILSGTGTDGSKGIQAIKAAGGITLAQDDHSAKYDGMPKSAVDTGQVDSILPPETLAKNLMDIIREHEMRRTSQRLNPKGLAPILKLLKEKLGQDFTLYKLPTIERRIMKRMGFLRFTQYDAYVEYLERTPGELGELAKDLLISVTSFFRDPEVFEDLAERLREYLRRNHSNHEFRAWIAGCATGEEAYTLAMIVLDIQEKLRKHFPVKIFATDLDHDAIQEARSAVYSNKDLQDFPKSFADRFTQPKNQESFEFTKRVRDCVVFARQDMIQNPPFVKLDLISCRNVMIYFEPKLQKNLLEVFHYSLLPSGFLLLGKSESILSKTPQLFEALNKKTKLFEKLNVPSQPLPIAKSSRSTQIDPAQLFSSRSAPSLSPLLEMGYKNLLEAYGIAGVIIDSEMTLLHVFGEVTPYVHFQNQPDLRLPHLLPQNIGVEIPLLIKKCQQNNAPVKSRTYKLGKGAKAVTFQIVLRQLNDQSEHKHAKGFYLASFENKKVKENAAEIVDTVGAMPGRYAELEQELFITKEHLQTVIEELGVSNEELQSLNEELSSTNEELQSSNEELETTNEELQSSNEELTTVNEELVAKSNELRSLTLGLENIQNSFGSPMLVLDETLRLSRYNSEANKVFFVTESDIGREITRISTRCEIPEFEARCKETLKTGKPSEALCESLDTVYQMRILPSFDENRRIIGVILVFIDNTERIRTQEKLEASEERTRAIIEASPSMVSLKDHLGRYLLANASFTSFFDITKPVYGKTDREILPEKIALQLRDADLEVFITRAAVRREEIIETAKHGKKVLLTSRFPIMDPAGRTPVAVGTIAIDITAQVESQEALKKSEARYRAIAEDQAVFVCRLKPDGSFTYVNDAFVRYFGGTPDSFKNRNFSEVVDSQDQDAVKVVLGKLGDTQTVEQHEHRVSRWQSETRWVRWIHRGIYLHGKLQEIQSVGFDVTEYRAQTEVLKQKEAVYGGIFDNTSDLVTLYKVKNGSLILDSFNPTAAKALGNAATQLLGKGLESFFGFDAGSTALQKYNAVVKNGKSQVFEEEVLVGGRVRHFLTTLVPIPNASGVIESVAALSRDVSGYKQIEQDLRGAKESAEVANRAKSDFLASMSHELRTPLNVVLGFSQMLELSHLDREQLNYVQGIHRSGQLLLSLIEDILDISKIEAGKIKLEAISFSVHQLVHDVIELFAAQAQEKGIYLSYKIAPEASRTAVSDPNRIRQILVNFVGNALKFTERGSVSIHVSAKSNPAEGEWLCRFAVIDTGIGIKEEDKTKIFQKFSQAESGHARRFGGSGLGLAISKQFANLMNGEVGFESRRGHGSTFWFEIPMVLSNKTPEIKNLQISKNGFSKEGTKLNILVVDDSIDSRLVAESFLKKLGHITTSVDGGRKALEILQQKEFDLVLMDMQMPEMDGCETTRSIRSQISQSLPIIALTANALSEDVEKCMAAGMNDYLSKPVRLEDLNNLLKKWAHRIFEMPELMKE